jgi:hypothetical protein
MSGEHKAFILMPFEEPFDAIFVRLISPALEKGGYRVRRADSVLDQQNVLRDIITGIDSADLIVADLTGLNSNVFYELGIAHGLGIPTVMLTQDIDEVPFDLRGYRVQVYSDRFDKAADLQKSITEIATGHAEGDVSFGSPVSDFLPDGQAARRLARRETKSASAEKAGDEDSGDDDGEPEGDRPDDDKGVLDLMSDVLSAAESIGVAGEKFNVETEAIGEKIVLHSEHLQKANSASSGSIPAAQVVARALAADLEGYAEALKEPVKEMDDVSHLFSDSTLVLLSRVEINDENREENEQYKATLDGLQATLVETRASLSGFQEAIASTKGWSARVDRANRKVSGQIEKVINSLDYLMASTSRASEIIDEKLSDEAASESS